MVETKLKGPSMAERIAARLRNSGEHAGQPGHEVVQKGTSPNRTFTNIHPGGGHVVPPKNEGNGR
jgi:hypothetical protein